MILDKENLMSDAQAVTDTQVSTDYIDLSSVRDVGAGEPIQVVCNINSAMLSGGASTLVVKLQTDTQSNFATAVDLITTPAIPKATLIAGYRPIKQALPEGVQRYIRMSYTVGTADFTGGNITAGLNLDQRQHGLYASGLRTTGF